jgi:hypothetical protein
MTRAQRTIGSLGALLLALVVGTAQAQPEFTGTWVLDRAQSQLPNRGAHGKGTADPQATPPEVKLIVEQQGNTLKATRSAVRGPRERAMSETFVADGSERTETTPRGGTSVTKATLGGDRLVVNTTHTRPAKDAGQPARSFSRESVWTLSRDGRTLTIDTTMHTPRGERTLKSVYTKAS